VPAAPIALVPEATQSTAESRAALPGSVPLADAAFTAGRAAVLGAALASGSEELFRAALADRLHEPYRSPFLAKVRASLPAGALGATLSGSGPTVIVWAPRASADECGAALGELYGDLEILPLTVARAGACG
jgi:homoserine kinase